MPKVINCQICNECSSKYKCPTCLLRYCGVACYKQHKVDDHCLKLAQRQASDVRRAAAPPRPALLSQLVLPTADTVHPDVLHQLRDSKELQDILRDPELREQLTELSSCSTDRQATPRLDVLMRLKKFRRFAKFSLEVVEPESNTFKDDEELMWLA